MANGDINTIYVKAFLGILSTAVIGLFVWVWSAQTTLTEMNFTINSMAEDMMDLKTDSEADTRQDTQLTKHWRIHSWSRQKINELETAAGKPISAWPDLD